MQPSKKPAKKRPISKGKSQQDNPEQQEISQRQSVVPTLAEQRAAIEQARFNIMNQQASDEAAVRQLGRRHQLPQASPLVAPNYLELAVWKHRLALAEQARTRYSYLQAALVQQQASRIDQARRLTVPESGSGILLRQPGLSLPLSTARDPAGEPSRKRRRVRRITSPASTRRKPRCGKDEALRSFPLPRTSGEQSLGIGSFTSYKRKWDALVHSAESLTIDEASKHKYVKRAFHEAIRGNKVRFDVEIEISENEPRETTAMAPNTRDTG